MIELTQHQNEVLEEACEFIKGGSNKLVIKGSAGTGKTTLVEFLINTCIEKRIIPSYGIYCSAPTHKAVKVLEGKMKVPGIEFKTIHSILGIRKVINPKTGEVSFKPSKSSIIDKVKTLIIDEASMLGEELLQYVEEAEVRTIFLGDTKQINPVKEVNSPVFYAGYDTVKLSKIVRQGEGNPIINLSNDLSIINLKEDNVTDKKGVLHTKDYARIIVSLAEVNGNDSLKYLAWTNKEVDQVNNHVRSYLYGGSPAKIELGESIVLDSGYGKYKNNEEITIDTLEVSEETMRAPDGVQIVMKCYVINSKRDAKSNKFPLDAFKIVHEDYEYAFKQLKWKYMALAKKRKLQWRDYFLFAEIFAEFKYNHALTIHKSQGSTYKQTIVNVKDINRNGNLKERKRLFYTAVTRASDLLILYKA